MNHLQHETSPYLLQHAHNPVDWHAWKPEAFAKAKKEDKPILVSIGYSTCHWCHVMERESFEDGEVAEFMNEHFVCIKVDREERPDVDQIYMEACQVLTGGGGWPLNCFLTPDAKPFYAGTYYPPMPAHNRPSWLQVLMNLSHAYQNRRETVEDQAERLLEIIRNAGKNFTEKKLQVVRDESPFSEALLDRVYQGLQRSFDTRNGGFGGAPKFPGTMSLHYLLDHHYYNGETGALQHLELSLDKMARGGIFDHLGGGFARYATDAAWLVPHFEKMLYDNALLVSLYSAAYKVTKKEHYKEAVEQTLEWVEREMTNGEGGFFSAQDADSEGIEGKFYVWEKKEIEKLLGGAAALFCKYHGVKVAGNWEGKNILWRPVALEDFAKTEKILPGALLSMLGGARQRLFAERKKRIPPGLDDKVLLDWNALMVSAFAKAYEAFGNENYRAAAVRNLRFLEQRFIQPDGLSLFHTYKDGRAQYDAFLDDYANLIEALLDVYEITFDTAYLLQADRYIGFVLENFLDEADGLFYFTSAKQQDIPLRRKDLYDSATPSGNATMVRNLQRLGILMGKEGYRQRATKMLLTMLDTIAKHPTSFSRWATSLAAEVHGVPEIAVVGAGAVALAGKLVGEHLPHRALMASEIGNGGFPLLEGKKPTGGTLIYVCKNYACQEPVRTIEAFKETVHGQQRTE